MCVKFGIWFVSDIGEEGIIEWVGGDMDYSDGLFIMCVKFFSINNYNFVLFYIYGDKIGDWESIEMSLDDFKDVISLSKVLMVESMKIGRAHV